MYLLVNGFFGGRGLVLDFFILGFLFIVYGVSCGVIGCFACLMLNQLIYALNVVCTISSQHYTYNKA
jgi:hypothetical protein